MSKVIVFYHPGTEHTRETGEGWNESDHRRKYLQVCGDYVDHKNNVYQPMIDTLYFWGEWEAESRCSSIAKSLKCGPSGIFDPYYGTTIGKVNTDPFVFGNQFYYCVCKQGHYPSLRTLKPKDLILFGSHKDGHFVLDTVFVIKGRRQYDINNVQDLKGDYPKAFYDVSLAPLVGTDRCESIEIDCSDDGRCTPNSDSGVDDKPSKQVTDYTLYEGVMYDEREKYDNMFSFVPAQVGQKGRQGFCRPSIKLNMITDDQKQGIKRSEENTCQVWKNIKQQVENHHQLMIRTRLPAQVLSGNSGSLQ